MKLIDKFHDAQDELAQILLLSPNQTHLLFKWFDENFIDLYQKSHVDKKLLEKSMHEEKDLLEYQEESSAAQLGKYLKQKELMNKIRENDTNNIHTTMELIVFKGNKND